MPFRRHRHVLAQDRKGSRAGESGRGFAVVANEVKDPARQTREATAEISTRIQSIKDQVRSAVEAFDSVRAELDGVSQNTAEVATTIEQQGTVTHDLARASRSLVEG
ncbi:MAG TPA: methyl-accepting chemotaxis protein [Planctomycetota bacterium]|nr:methyl-accepting chemotaxis protein [Planctomycetota bacterium]